MHLGLIGLGKMGGNMRERLRRAGHTVTGFDHNPELRDVDDLDTLVAGLTSPRVVWVMVPSGDPTHATIESLGELLDAGDVVVDGGNSRWTDDQSHAAHLAERGIGFVDCGVSGGVWGLENGYALMSGGSADDIATCQPIFDALKPDGEFGYVHAGPVGAGHFAKMVHNGIEYGLMQAYAEGYELLAKAEVVENVPEVLRSWREGTVIRSWLLDLLVAALDDDPGLSGIAGWAEDSGEGRWTVEAAIDHAVPMNAIAASLFARFASRQEESTAMKAVAAMRNQFGGHAVKAGGGDARDPCRRHDGDLTPPRPIPPDRPRPTVHVAHLSLRDFRSYPEAEVALEPGATAFVGPNGQGKTNLVEAVDYLATLASHRVATDTPLVRVGADSAVLRARVVRDAREALIEIELVPGGSNRARVNRAPLPRVREVLGLLRAVVFSPEDLDLVKGDPHDRRRFLDQLLIARAPRLAAVRADYDRVLKQRNTLLKSASGARRSSGARGCTAHPRRLGRPPGPHGGRAAGRTVAAGRPARAAGRRPLPRRRRVRAAGPHDRDHGVRAVVRTARRPRQPDREVLRAALLAEVATRRDDELDRGVTLVGPHRDELRLGIGELPAKGYASHGESWSLALSLRLAAYDLLKADGDDPVLVLDDVFAELDTDRRDRLAASVSAAEQVLVTAAVPADVPELLKGARYDVMGGSVRRVR